MGQLPRGLEEAAQASIATYERQVAAIERILDAGGVDNHLAIAEQRPSGAVAQVFALEEDCVIEALSLLVSAKQASIRVLREGIGGCLCEPQPKGGGVLTLNPLCPVHGYTPSKTGVSE